MERYADQETKYRISFIWGRDEEDLAKEGWLSFCSCLNFPFFPRFNSG